MGNLYKYIYKLNITLLTFSVVRQDLFEVFPLLHSNDQLVHRVAEALDLPRRREHTRSIVLRTRAGILVAAISEQAIHNAKARGRWC